MPENLDSFSSQVSQSAREDFNDAYRRGFWHSLQAWLGQHSNELLPFDEVLRQLPIRGQHYVGLIEVLIDHIVGSVSRYHDFDRAFLPRQTHTRERWENIDKAHLQDVFLPPIELYKVGDLYFVKDGNHRVSVARERGQQFIDAQVIEIDAPVELNPGLELHDLVLKIEQAFFIQQTYINEVRPDILIEFTLPNQYNKLREHIRVHRWFMGEELKREIGDTEAVGGWVDDVYLPLINIIRSKKILKEFPGRTEADLYLWIIEHRYYLMEEYKNEVSLERAATHFVSTFSRKSFFRHLKVFSIKIKRLFKKRK